MTLLAVLLVAIAVVNVAQTVFLVIMLRKFAEVLAYWCTRQDIPEERKG